jgi:zinc protease
VQSAAFSTHPYQHEIVGSMEDLHSMQRDDLYRHYRAYYCPNNAVLSMAGDFDSQEMLARIHELYRDIPAGKPALHPAQPEPPSTAEKRLEVQGPGETTYLQVAYHAPAVQDPDFYAFTVVDSLLAGPTSLNMFGGGGTSNRTSRLYRALVEKELAVSVHGGLQATIDPYFYDVIATVRSGQTAEAVMAAMDGEIKRLQDGLVPEAEIARAIKQARALFAYGSENITNQAFWLGHAEMFASYEWFVNYVDSLAAVTPADVQRIAQAYLQPANRVAGIYLANGEEGESE